MQTLSPFGCMVHARQDSDYDLAIAFNDFSLDALARYVRHIVWRWIGLRAGAHFSSIE